MIYFKVKNLEKYQHYKDRNPPWIKLYLTLLTDYEFSCLQDASKLHLILIWLLASKYENELPYDKNWIRESIHCKDEVNLDELSSYGFIIKINNVANCLQDASIVLASCTESAIPRDQRSENRNIKRNIKEKKDSLPDPSFLIFYESYPRHIGKSSAEKAWKKIRSSEEVMEGLERWKQYWDSERTEQRFIPYPATWLNKNQWLDELPVDSLSDEMAAYK